MTHIDINPGHVSLTTAHAPADNTRQLPHPSHVTDQGTASISFTSILALLTSSTQEPRVEDEVVSQSGLLQLPLTVKVSEDRQIDLLEDVLVGATLAEGVLAPSTDPTPFAGKVLEGIRQTYWGYVSISGKVNEPIQLDDRNVVVQVARIVFWMNLGKYKYDKSNVSCLRPLPSCQEHRTQCWGRTRCRC